MNIQADRQQPSGARGGPIPSLLGGPWRVAAVSLRFYAARPALAALCIVLMLVGSALVLVAPFLTRDAVQELSSRPRDVAIVDLIWAPGILILVGVTAAATLVSAVRTYLQDALNERLVESLRTRLYADWLAGDPSPDDYSAGIISRLTTDVGTTRGGIDATTYTLPVAIIQWVGSLTMMLVLSPTLFALMIAVILVVGILFASAERRLVALSAEVQKAYSELVSLAVDVLADPALVKRFGQEMAEVSRFQRAQQDVISTLRRRRRFQSGLRLLVLGGVATAFVLVALAGLAKSADGSISTGDLVAFLLLAVLCGTAFIWMIDAITALSRAVPALDRITALPRRRRSLRPPGAKVLGEVPALDVRDLSFRYGGVDQSFELSGVNFRVEAGATVAFVGATGSGKSTLLRLLAGELEPDAGAILLNQTSLDDLDPADLKRRIAYLGSVPAILTRSLGENILYGDPQASRAQVDRVLATAELMEVVADLPTRLETILWSRGEQLSSGQKQRLSLARSLLLGPYILLLDEASAAVDSATEAKLVRNLEALHGEATKIVVSHRLSTIRSADWIYVFSAGRLVEEGTHDQLSRARGHYYHLFASQLVAEGSG